jgi:hypothetical protein
MSHAKAKKLGYLAAGAAILALFAAQGCGSDDNTQAKPTAGAGGAHSMAGAGGKANGAGAGGKANGTAGKTSGNGGDGENGGTDEMGGAPPSDGGAPTNPPGDGGSGGEAGATGPVTCEGDDGCYSCTPKTNEQLLNHCVPGGCPATFDNSKLSQLNKVGTL